MSRSRRGEHTGTPRRARPSASCAPNLLLLSPHSRETSLPRFAKGRETAPRSTSDGGAPPAGGNENGDSSDHRWGQGDGPRHGEDHGPGSPRSLSPTSIRSAATPQ